LQSPCVRKAVSHRELTPGLVGRRDAKAEEEAALAGLEDNSRSVGLDRMVFSRRTPEVQRRLELENASSLGLMEHEPTASQAARVPLQ
jgi:hypothetical protein